MKEIFVIKQYKFTPVTKSAYSEWSYENNLLTEEVVFNAPLFNARQYDSYGQAQEKLKSISERY